MSKTRIATCGCNQVQVKTVGEPIRSAICHCLSCQKRTGSVFGVQVRFKSEQVTTDGELNSFTRIADSGNEVTQQFCANCGTTMIMKLAVIPEFTVIPMGVFDANDFPTPKFSVYEERKVGWAKFDNEIERFN